MTTDNGLPHMGTPDGKALYRSYQAAEGERRRVLHGQLIIANEPLARTLVDQMCGRGEPRINGKKTWYRPLGGCQGMRDIGFEDALQAGRLALLKAFEQFNPAAQVTETPDGFTFGKRPTVYATFAEAAARASFSSYLKNKIRHELQEVVNKESRVIHCPRDDQGNAVPVALTDDERLLDDLSGGAEDGVAALDEVTPEELERWRAEGVWPESLEQLRCWREWERQEKLVPEPDPETVGGLEAFLTRRVTFAPRARVETWRAHNAYRLECRRLARPEMPRHRFVAELRRLADVREVWIRTPNAPSERALAHMRLLSA